MPKISPQAKLKDAILLLETEHAIQGKQLKDQLYSAYKNYKPGMLFNNTLKNIVKSPLSIDNILGAAMGLTTGYLAKKILIGATGSILKKIIGSALQLGVTYLVARKTRHHPAR